jgi:hypothetical protein
MTVMQDGTISRPGPASGLVVEMVQSYMEKLAGLGELIGAPYHYLTITEKGIATV